MHRRIQVKNATIVNEGRQFVGSLLIDNTQIEEIIEGKDAEFAEPALEIIDAEGLYLLPGMIDMNTHFRAPGNSECGTWQSESQAAAAGGVTTVIDMPDNLPSVSSLEAVENKMEWAHAHSHINFGIYFEATPYNYKWLSTLDPRKVAAIHLLLGSCPELSPGSPVLEHIFEGVKIPFVVECEDYALFAANMERAKALYGEDPSLEHLSEIYSAEGYNKATRWLLEKAAREEAQVHVMNVCTKRQMSLIKRFPEVTCSVSVPHLWFSHEDYGRMDTRIKCRPALQSEKDRLALWKNVEKGEIHSVVSNHMPHLIRSKQGFSAEATTGISCVQSVLAAMLDKVVEGQLTLEQLVELTSHNPARILQIENRGFLRPGYKADFVLIDTNQPFTLTPNRLYSRCNWNVFDGHTFKCRIKKVFSNGHLVYNRGHLANTYKRGYPITFER